MNIYIFSQTCKVVINHQFLFYPLRLFFLKKDADQPDRLCENKVLFGQAGMEHHTYNKRKYG